MSNLITLSLEAPPQTVSVFVDFYDDAERDSLLNSTMKASLERLPITLEIPTADFCTHYLYYKKQPGVPSYSNHDEVAKHWQTALVEFDGQVEFANSSLKLIAGVKLDTGTTERIGESIGLSVASHLHSLHQADWSRVPETNRRKTLDFWHPWIASDGEKFIQLETKGSSVDNNEQKSPSISNHKKSIKAKKSNATDEERKTSVLYGTIGVLDSRSDTVARCWIVDPPTNVPDDPERFKTISRMRFIANIISLLAPRSALAAALRTRLEALSAIQDITPLAGQSLRKGDGSKFSTAAFFSGRDHNPLFQSKCIVADRSVGGQVAIVNGEHHLFIGIQEALVVNATNQDFNAIRRYAFLPEISRAQIECVISKGRFARDFARRLKIPEAELKSSTDGYVRFELPARLFFSKSGLVFGELEIPKEWQARQ